MFDSYEEIEKITFNYKKPLFLYDEQKILKSAQEAIDFQAPYGLTVRYAMKANSNKAILNTLVEQGVHIDASSEYEAQRAILSGIPASKILITTQEYTEGISTLIQQGVLFDASSLEQLRLYGEKFPKKNVGVRINPGLGSGGSNRTNVGGISSSFGIWHEYLNKVNEIANKYNLNINRVHTHIGSGSDPTIWTKVAHMSIDLLNYFKNANILNLGGGYKIDRMNHSNSTDLQLISKSIKSILIDFYQQTKRKIHLEIEPGTYLLANAGYLVTQVTDIVDTGKNGYTFAKLNSGMTELLRPSLYGAQHPIKFFPKKKTNQKKSYIVVGHCCESGDIFTPKEAIPEELSPRNLEQVNIGDYAIIGGVGAYCSSMSAKNYNTFPEVSELMLMTSGQIILIKKRQTISQMIQNEI